MPVTIYQQLTGDAQIALTQFSYDMMGAYLSEGEPITEAIGDTMVTDAPRVRIPVPISGLQYQELVDEQKFIQLGAKSLEIIQRTFQAGVKAKRSDIENPMWIGWDRSPEALGVAARIFPDSLVGTLLSGGHAGAACWDGAAHFFAADHPVNCMDETIATPGGDYIWSNYDATLTLASEAHVGSALTLARTVPGPNGLPLRMRPKYVIVPPALEDTANKRFLYALVSNATGNAGIENPYKNALQIVVLPELTSATSWYIVSEKIGLPPWKIVRRPAPEIIIRDKTSALYQDHLQVSVSGILEVEAALAAPHAICKFGAP